MFIISFFIWSLFQHISTSKVRPERSSPLREPGSAALGAAHRAPLRLHDPRELRVWGLSSLHRAPCSNTTLQICPRFAETQRRSNFWQVFKGGEWMVSGHVLNREKGFVLNGG